MPCYEVRTYSIEFKAGNWTLLDAAIKSVGATLDWASDDKQDVSLFQGGIQLNLATGVAKVQDGYQTHLNALKRAYSQQALRSAAKSAKWQIGTAEGVANKGRLMRRVG